MFVIPSKYVEGASKIFFCIQAINTFHSNERILVVDSDSDDKSYLNRLKEYPNVIISDYINPHRGAGALWRSFYDFPDEKFYFMIQDSMIIKKSFEKFLYDENTWNLMYFHEGPFMSREWSYVTHVLSQTKYQPIKNLGHIGVFGANCIYKSDILQKMVEKGLSKALLPADKFESQQKERIMGICLMQEGVDIIQHSVEGDFLSKVGRVNNNQLQYFQKIYGGRQ